MLLACTGGTSIHLAQTYAPLHHVCGSTLLANHCHRTQVIQFANCCFAASKQVNGIASILSQKCVSFLGMKEMPFNLHGLINSEYWPQMSRKVLLDSGPRFRESLWVNWMGKAVWFDPALPRLGSWCQWYLISVANGWDTSSECRITCCDPDLLFAFFLF